MRVDSRASPATVKAPALWGLSCLLVVVIVAAALTGVVPISPGDLFSASLSETQQTVLYSLRLPRVMLAAVVGAALAVSGAAMQGLFRNPLADPGLIGVAGGAALAVAVMLVLVGPGANALGLYGLSLAAFAGGLGACALIFKFAKLTGSFSVTYMLLAGIAINALTGAGTGFLSYISDDEQLRALTFWTMGGVDGALWPAVIIGTTIIAPAIIALIRNGQRLNILLLGEEEARHLGVNSERLKRTVMLCTSLSVGAAVALTGIIGFIGLVVPHLIRLFIGPDHRVLIPASAVLGALLLVAADTFARTMFSPAEVPVGILTSLIGGPFFLWLLMKHYRARFAI